MSSDFLPDPTDYGVEGVVPDFQLEAENVVILQDRAFEGSDVDFISESITAAIEDMERVSCGILSLEAAVQVSAAAGSHPKLAALTTLTRTRQYREMMERKHGRATIPAFESAQTNGTVFALEDELHQERGLLRRIWDRIVAMFTWLWKKISGLFASGELSEEVEKKAKKAGDRAKDAVVKGASFANVTVDTAEMERAFGYLGHVVTSRMLQTHLQTSARHADTFRALANVLSAGFKTMTHLVDGGTVSSEAVKTANATTSNAIRSQLHSFKAESASSVQFSRELTAYIEAHPKTTLHVLTDFIYGNVLAITVTETDQGVTMFHSAFGGPGTANQKVRIDLPDAGEIDMLAKALLAAIWSYGSKLADFKKMADDGARQLDALNRAGDKLMASSSDQQAQVVNLLKTQGESIVTVFTHLVAGMQSVKKSINETSLFLERYIRAIEATVKVQ